jgi:hypothetical protein
MQSAAARNAGGHLDVRRQHDGDELIRPLCPRQSSSRRPARIAHLHGYTQEERRPAVPFRDPRSQNRTSAPAATLLADRPPPSERPVLAPRPYCRPFGAPAQAKPQLPPDGRQMAVGCWMIKPGQGEAKVKRSRLSDSNRRPVAYKATALPAELRRRREPILRRAAAGPSESVASGRWDATLHARRAALTGALG